MSDRGRMFPDSLEALFDPDTLAARLTQASSRSPEALDHFRVNQTVSPFGRVFRSGVRTVFRIVPDRGLMMRYLPKGRGIKAPRGTHVQRVVLPQSSMLMYRPMRRHRGTPARTVFHVHGGGFMSGLGYHYRRVAQNYLQLPGVALVASVDYRNLPMHPYPAALEDVYDAWRYLMIQGTDPKSVVMTGDSAGGNLVLALLLMLRDRGDALPLGACVQSPWTDMTFSGDSIVTNLYRDPMFGVDQGRTPKRQEYVFFVDYAGTHDPKDPYLSPVFGDYQGLPPIHIQTGSDEMLLSDSWRVYDACVAAGVPARFSIYEGMFHSFSIISGHWTHEGSWARKEEYAAIEGLWDGYAATASLGPAEVAARVDQGVERISAEVGDAIGARTTE